MWHFTQGFRSPTNFVCTNCYKVLIIIHPKRCNLSQSNLSYPYQFFPDDLKTEQHTRYSIFKEVCLLFICNIALYKSDLNAWPCQLSYIFFCMYGMQKSIYSLKSTISFRQAFSRYVIPIPMIDNRIIKCYRYFMEFLLLFECFIKTCYNLKTSFNGVRHFSLW